jgi:hypothetical protein
VDATIPPEALLAGYPWEIQAQAATLRALLRQAVPDAVERVRGGWRLIGYEVPLGKRHRYFAWISPEPIHIHLGFEYGAWMADPDRRLEGSHLKLRKVRFLTFRPGDAIPEPACLELLHEAVRVAALSRDERLALALDRDWAPDGVP